MNCGISFSSTSSTWKDQGLDIRYAAALIPVVGPQRQCATPIHAPTGQQNDVYVDNNLMWYFINMPLQACEKVAAARDDSGIVAATHEFADRLGIGKQLAQAIGMARRHFAVISSVRAYPDRDPDDGEEYVVLEINSGGDPEEDTQSYMNYLDDWSAAVDWPASQMIRLNLNWPV